MAIIVSHGFFYLEWEIPYYSLKIFPITPIKKLTYLIVSFNINYFGVFRWECFNFKGNYKEFSRAEGM